MKFFLITTGFFLIIPAMLKAQDKNERAVAKATEQLRVAMIEADRNGLENRVSDHLSYGHSSGAVDDKKMFVEKIVSGRSDFVSIELTDQTIQVTGKVAIVRHTLRAKTNDNGNPGEVQLKIMLVWQKTNGRWKLLARQAVKF
jgi:ketosteroid isomerase-like protein